MTENIHWLGHDSFRFDGSTTVYVDPWKLASAAPAADVILITHEHSDHFSPDDIARILSSRTLIVGPASVTKGLADAGAVTMTAGETITAGTATITAVPASATLSSSMAGASITPAIPM